MPVMRKELHYLYSRKTTWMISMWLWWLMSGTYLDFTVPFAPLMRPGIYQPVCATGRIGLKLICFDSIQFQEYVYTSGAESNQFDLSSICGTTFTCVVHITRVLVRSSSIRFNLSTTVQSGTIRIKAVRFDSCLHYEWNRTSSNWFKFAC